jgi:hypothetical protein
MRIGKKDYKIKIEKETEQEEVKDMTEEEILLRAKNIMEKNTVPLGKETKEEPKEEQIELNDMSNYKLTVVNLLAGILEEIKKLRE